MSRARVSILAIAITLCSGAGASAADGGLTALPLTSMDRSAIARVAFAEAGSQGESGLAGVVYVILNRRASGYWGATIDAVLNAPRQFEPVTRVGGNWRQLPFPTPTQQARVDTIINLIAEGRLPDLTNGARYFQNPAIVAMRAIVGTVPRSLIRFGNRRPSAVIGAHEFFPEAGGQSRRTQARTADGGGPIFFTTPSTSSQTN